MAKPKPSLWGFGGLKWKELGKRVWNEMNTDDVWGRAAQLYAQAGASAWPNCAG